MEKKKNLIKKFCMFSIGPIASAILSFISTPLFTYYISPEEYGKASMFSTAISILEYALFLGLDQAYIKRYYEVEDSNTILINAFVPMIVSLLCIESIIFIFKEKVSYILFGNGNEYLCVYALMIAMIGILFERLILLDIRMRQNGLLYSLMHIVLKILLFIFTVLSLTFYERSFRSIVIGVALSEIICAIILFVIDDCFRNTNIKNINIKEIKSLLKFGLPLIPASIISWLLNGLSNILIRIYCGYTELGLYSVALKIVAVMTIFKASFTTFWTPIAYKWNSENVEKENYEKMGKVVMFVMSLLFVAIMFMKEFVFLIFKKEYIMSAQIAPFLLFGPVMDTVAQVFIVGIYFNEKTKYIFRINLTVFIFNALISYFLIPTFAAKGAAIATGLSFVFYFILVSLYSKKIWFDLSIKPYIFSSVILLIVATVNTFIEGKIMYITNIVCLCIIVFYNIKDIKKYISSILVFLKSKLDTLHIL